MATSPTVFAMLGGFGVSSVGSYDACRALDSRGFHFCDLRPVQGPVIR